MTWLSLPIELAVISQDGPGNISPQDKTNALYKTSLKSYIEVLAQ